MMPPPPLPVRLRTAIFAAFAAAAVAVVAVGGLYLRDPALRLEMDSPARGIVQGLYEPERSAAGTFAWSRERVSVRVPGGNGSVPWACNAALINWRPPTAGPARVVVTSGSTTLLDTVVATPQATMSFVIPAGPAPEPAADLSITPTFRPGPSDPRTLGLVFDWIRCAPAAGHRAWPPRALLLPVAAASAIVAIAFALAGVPAIPLACVMLVLVGGFAVAVSIGLAPFTPGAPPLITLAILAAVLFALPVWLLDATGWRVISRTARVAIAISAVAAIIKLAFLLHPGKPVVDALFHAHRFGDVLAGRWYFTQLSTSATPFPYAIGLYLFAAPWSVLTDDHVRLLRLVVTLAEGGVGLLLYTMLARLWDERVAGVVAVGLFHAVVLPYVVIGNANLTNAFGQSASLAALAAATVWILGRRTYLAAAGVSVLVAFALICHVSIVVLLGMTLGVLVAITAAMAPTRERTRLLAAAVLLGAVISVVVYWGHFGDVYRRPIAATAVGRMLGVTASAAEPAPASSSRPGPAVPKRVFTYTARDAAEESRRQIGWPVLLLALIGAWEVVRQRRRDPLAALLASLVAVGVTVVAVGAFAPVPERLQQDVWEFMGRAVLASYPGVVMLAGYGAARAWQTGLAGRVVASLLTAAAVPPAVAALRAWLP